MNAQTATNTWECSITEDVKNVESIADVHLIQRVQMIIVGLIEQNKEAWVSGLNH